jgi:predicted RNA-binding Zn-ribbon protein involved in translation (DUF1610 family)
MHSHAELRGLLATVEKWYEQAPAGLSIAAQNEWVQAHAAIPCPDCGQPLFLLRTQRARGRGYYKLVICQNSACTFQVDDDTSFHD